MLKKPKNTLNYLKDKVFSIYVSVKGTVLALHQRLLQHNTLYSEAVTFINPYQLFISWLLDIFQYTIIGTIVVLLLLKFKWLGLGLAFGLIRWLLFDTIKTIKEQ